MAGWEGITSLICLGDDREIYDIDIRYAWGAEIFKQNLCDYGWSEETLLNKSQQTLLIRHKIIIYLCESSTGLKLKQKIESVSQNYLIGQYWQTIDHCYLLLPLEHPFKLPELTERNITNNNFATTCLLTKEKLIKIENNNEQLQTILVLPPHSQRQGEGGLRTKGLYKQQNNKLPLVSVITVVLNGEKYLEQTIQSIINTSYANVEYIVIDGGSTDSSLDIIKKYEEQIDYWVSEPDSGIYDAMNKGTLASLGKYTLHINADDLIFDPLALERRISELKNIQIKNLPNLFSSTLFVRLAKGEVVKKIPKKPYSDRAMNIIRIPGGHQGFIGVRNKNSLFDSRYKLIAERIAISHKIDRETIDISSNTLAICRSGGASYGINFQMLDEIKQAVSDSKNPKVFFHLLAQYLYFYLLLFAKITKLVKLKQKLVG
ncbi:glycosyltransferase [Pleurocapsales cyanobacterium LEGE 06147]|nr:glycosyltransferase [Pleurocapsales cyanobacterium LEGE 06147]